MKTLVLIAAVALGIVDVRAQGATFANVIHSQAQNADDRESFQAALVPQREGRDREAFTRFLAIPGGEHAAVTLARPKAAEFLALLRNGKFPQTGARAKLVEADLLLVLSRLDEARQLCHKLATEGPARHWNTDREDYYPVEPAQNVDADQMLVGQAGFELLEPFTVGPGSHRDNWLLRRLIALELEDDAAGEFARIWRIHCANTLPYVAVSPAYDERGNVVSQKKHVVRPVGFDGRGLQFAIDYAFFLKRRGDTNAALGVLLEPLRKLDFDRNPNNTRLAEEIPHATQHALPERSYQGNRMHFGYGGFGGNAGISRKEFLRLAFGEFKASRRESALYAAVQKQINAGDNRARRVLARLRSLAGQTDVALALELDYIAHADFSEASAAWRRGLVYEEYQKSAKAADSLERFLALASGKLALDLPESQELEPGTYAQLTFGMEGLTQDSRLQLEAFMRLQRLYAALGETDKALSATLRQFELTDASLSILEQLEQIAQRFRGAGREQQFLDWANLRLRDTKSPQVRANIAWQLKDYQKVIETLSSPNPFPNAYELQPWKERFAKLGTNEHRALLKAIVAGNPKDSISHLELLDLNANLDGPEAIRALVMILDTNATDAFARRKNAHQRTQFTSYFDLAHRLARLYERNGQLEQLNALGLRIARGEKPFDKFDPNQGYSDSNGIEEHGNAALAIAIQHADDERTHAQWREALQNSRWSAARAQLERRISAQTALAPGTSDNGAGRPLWVNLPTNVTVLASAENVLSLVRDDKFVYAGQPWGVSVYDFAGMPVARVALGEAALVLAAGPQALWAGTPKGLFRIARSGSRWTVAHQWLHDDVAEQNRHAHHNPGPGAYAYDNCVLSLAVDGDLLWIGLRRNIQVLNTRNMELRAFSKTELKIDQLGDFNRIVPDGDVVWADGYVGLRRYDRASGRWEIPDWKETRAELHFLDIIDGQVFVNAYVNDVLRYRPAVIDRRTLRVTPMFFEPGQNHPNGEMLNQYLQYFGKRDGKLIFSGNSADHGFGQPYYALDTASGKLHPLGTAAEKFSEQLWAIQRDPGSDSRLRGGQQANRLREKFGGMFGLPSSPGWRCVELPGGTLVLGSKANEVRYEYPQEDDRTRYRDGSDTQGGLFFVANGVVRRVSSTGDSAGLRGDFVSSLLFDDETKRDWLCTDVGLAELDHEVRVRQQFARAEGLCANALTGGTKAGGRFYFAAGWGGSGGGLIEFDPRTRVFTSWHRMDGLDADKLEKVEADGDRLKLTFAFERFHNGDLEYVKAAPGRFDPATGRFASGGEAQRRNGSEPDPMDRRKTPREPLPFLGGWVTEKTAHDGKDYLCGTRGLVVMRGAAEPLEFASLGARVVTDPEQGLLAEAKGVSVPDSIPLDRLRELLTHSNGFVRARALAAAMDPMREKKPGYVALVSACVTDSFPRVRATAVWLLSRSDDAAVLAPLRVALSDNDRDIRFVAALALARRGESPATGCFEEMIEHRQQYREENRNFPFGADSAIGVEVDLFRIYEALAPRTDRWAFRLFMKHPLGLNSDSGYEKVFDQLGAALRRQPELVEELLPAVLDERGTSDLIQFAERVFKHAGRELLPVLHRALSSEDRVIRSNAARACGAIGEASSNPHLIRALDLESGLSRASIVRALGDLKATEALPRLTDLYIDARNDEMARAGAGFRHAQAAMVASAQFDALRSLDAIAGDWDELKAAARSKLRDQLRNEDRLTTRHILDAVRKIGPAAAQEFYRKLAGGKSVEERGEGAIGLAECIPADRGTNVIILRNLLSDSAPPLRARAVVSLLILDEAWAQPQVLEKLVTGDDPERSEILGQLDRLNGAQLQFARKAIESLASDARLPRFLKDQASQLLAKLNRTG